MKLSGRAAATLLAGLLLMAGCGGSEEASSEPSVPTADGKGEADDDNSTADAADYKVKFETTKGDFVVAVHGDWAPKGAERFGTLVKEGYYDDCRFFRVVEGFVVQFGINGDPQVSAKWREKTIPDDPVKASNTKGTITFATSGPDSRTTQAFINLADNSQLDQMGFASFGEVVEGMKVVESLYAGYGEKVTNLQGQIHQQGNAFLDENFPRLDSIKKATIIDPDGAENSQSEE